MPIDPEVLIPLSFFFLIGFVFFQLRRRADFAIQRRYELGVKTLERFNDAETLEKFLSSEAGREFLSLLDDGDAPVARRLMRTMQAGLLIAFLGLAFLLLAAFVEPEVVFPGVILLGIGSSLLVGTVISLRMARRWNLVDSRQRRRPSGTPYREVIE
jgi:hypothetical protein